MHDSKPLNLPSSQRHAATGRSRLVLCALLLTPVAGKAAPSGGLYGPVDEAYAVPGGAPHVYYVAPDGVATESGVAVDHPTTIESAFDRVVTGDAIVLRGGTYRTGNLQLNQGIVMQPYRDEHPVLKGTRIATNWIAQPNGLWRTTWQTLFPAKPADWWERERNGRETPVYRFNNDMVFADGKLLHAVGWEGAIDAGSYYIDYDAGQVYVGVDPARHVIEITAFDNAVTRVTTPCHGKAPDHRGPIIRGITFSQYAFRAFEIEGKEAVGLSDPRTFGKDVVGTTLENDTITYCSRVAGYFRGDHLTIRNCLISDTRTEGVFVLSSADVLLERNIFRRNNIENIQGYFPAAVKIFDQCYRATCRDNLIIDQPNSNGIWYDVGNVDGRFIDNWVEGAQAGFFFEISKGAICAGNIFVNCDHGVWSLNSSNVQAYHNTMIDSKVTFQRTDRTATNDHFGWHPSTGPDVDKRDGHVFVGNLLVATTGFRRPLLEFKQSKVLCGRLTRPQAARIDGNAFIRQGSGDGEPLVRWSPAAGASCTADFGSLIDFRKAAPEFSAHDVYIHNHAGAVFRSAELDRLQPLKTLPSDAAVPENVRALLGWPAGAPLSAGAYVLPR